MFFWAIRLFHTRKHAMYVSELPANVSSGWRTWLLTKWLCQAMLAIFLRISTPIMGRGRENVCKLPWGSVTCLLSPHKIKIKKLIKNLLGRNHLVQVERSLLFDWEMHLFIFSCFLASSERGRFIWNSIMYYVWGEPEITQWRVRKVSCTLGWHRVLTRRMSAALTGIITAACIIPFLHASCLFPVTPGRHLITSPCCREWTIHEGLTLHTESRNWILLPTHEE